MVMFLIRKGVNVHFYNEDGISLATLALLNNQGNTIFFVLAEHDKTILVQRNRDGSSLLEFAIKNDLIFHFKYILENACIIESMLYAHDGQKLLDLAIEFNTVNSTLFIDLLIKLEAIIKIQKLFRNKLHNKNNYKTTDDNVNNDISNVNEVD
jgi:hypothetical protein